MRGTREHQQRQSGPGHECYLLWSCRSLRVQCKLQVERGLTSPVHGARKLESRSSRVRGGRLRYAQYQRESHRGGRSTGRGIRGHLQVRQR